MLKVVWKPHYEKGLRTEAMGEIDMKARRRKRRLTILAVAGVVLCGGASWLAIAKPWREKITTVTIERRTLRDQVDVSGSVEARKAVALKAEIAGPVTAVYVAEGQRAAAGATLLAIDPETASLQRDQAQRNSEAQLSQSGTELSGAERALAQATERKQLTIQGLRNEVERARTALDRAEQDAATSRRLAAEGAVSQQSADQAETALKQARIALRTASDSLDRAIKDDTELVAARNRVDTAHTASANARKQGNVAVELAERTLAKTSLKAPFAGTVTQWLVKKGDYVAPGTPLASFQDLQDLVLKLPVDETDLPKMRIGGPVEITFDAYPDRRIPGKILTIGTASTPVKDVMVFPVEVRFANADGAVKPGMSGDAEVLLKERQNAVAVPLTAVQRDKGRYFVKLRKANKTVEQTFQPGIITLEYVEALSGIQPGDQVVIPTDKATGAK